MTTARFIVADVFDGLASLPDGSVDCVVTSPPYLRQRRYLLTDHPLAEREMGQEGTPGEFLEALLCVMDELWRVLSDDGTFWVNLGTKHAGSGGARGDYNGGARLHCLAVTAGGFPGHPLYLPAEAPLVPWEGRP